MKEFFSSDHSKDQINIFLIKKSHRAIFKLISIDNSTEHINLLNKIIIYLKKNDIKWVETEIDFEPVIPTNTVSFINKYNNFFVCHIEDFERFYRTNIKNLIKINYLHHEYNKVSDDGWIKISCPKKDKKDKYDNLINELISLIGDWNSQS